MDTESKPKGLQITKLHPTFGAEVSGVDFSNPIADDVLQEITSAMAKVGEKSQAIAYHPN